MNGSIEKELTVQRRDTSVPASEGDQAGPMMSRSSNCNVTAVAHLAAVTDKDTSIKDKENITPHPDIFQRSSKTMRSPIGSFYGTPSAPVENNVILVDICSDEEDRDSSKPQTNNVSPTMEFILKMRRKEEKALIDIKKVLKNMKTAMQKQRNININVKDGVQQIDELLCVAETSRAGWMRVEEERKVKPQIVETGNFEDTPVTSKSKRGAESPLEQLTKNKKPRGQGGWETVSYKKAARNLKKNPIQTVKVDEMQNKPKENAPNPKSDAIIIKPSEGHTYAEVLKKLRENQDEETTKKVRGIRKTKTGALLLQLEKGEQANSQLLDGIKQFLKETAEIRSASPTTTLKLRDLDALTTTEEVYDAIKGLINIDKSRVTINITKPKQYGASDGFYKDSYLRCRRVTQNWIP